jgi:hypothetical protein
VSQPGKDGAEPKPPRAFDPSADLICPHYDKVLLRRIVPEEGLASPQQLCDQVALSAAREFLISECATYSPGRRKFTLPPRKIDPELSGCPTTLESIAVPAEQLQVDLFVAAAPHTRHDMIELITSNAVETLAAIGTSAALPTKKLR